MVESEVEGSVSPTHSLGLLYKQEYGHNLGGQEVHFRVLTSDIHGRLLRVVSLP